MGDEDVPSVVAAKVDGSILPMKVQRFLLGVVGESVVSLGLEISPISNFDSVTSEERRFETAGAFVVSPGAIIPSNPTKRFAAVT